MEAGNSQQDYIDQAVKRYSSLFTLPSHGWIVLFLALLCFFGGFFTILPFTQIGFGIVLGAGFFAISVLSDVVVCVLLRSEPIYNARRCNALSLVSNVLWFALMFVGTGLGVHFRNADLWLKLFLLGFCAVSLLRLLVYSATLFNGYARALVSALVQPVLWLVFLYFAWPFATGKSVGLSFFVFPLISMPVMMTTIFLFIYSINHVGRKTLGVSSIDLLKAFLANWIEDVNEQLENILEKLGTEQSMDVSLLVFKAKKGVKATIVVPTFHPGPFKNVGSSPLPYMIQSSLEKQLNCVVAVPHGLFGHELDLASQVQNQKVLDAIHESLDFQSFSDKASSFIRVKSGMASAGCQIFGDQAVLTLTIAPETTEDLPQELGFLAIEEAKKRRLASAVVINAHNSINDDGFRLEKAMTGLRKATVESLEKAAEAKRSTLKVGAAKVVPTEFSLEDGMGEGGISTIVTSVDGQTTAYVTIDGNNVVSGLREKILAALKEVGVNDSEVLTTDTHAVSAVVLNRRGYHPLGEVIDHEKLIAYIKQAVSKALNNLESVEMAWRTITVPNVKVIGAKQIEALCTLTDRATKQAKKSAVLLFPIVGAVLVALLLLL